MYTHSVGERNKRESRVRVREIRSAYARYGTSVHFIK